MTCHTQRHREKRQNYANQYTIFCRILLRSPLHFNPTWKVNIHMVKTQYVSFSEVFCVRCFFVLVEFYFKLSLNNFWSLFKFFVLFVCTEGERTGWLYCVGRWIYIIVCDDQKVSHYSNILLFGRFFVCIKIYFCCDWCRDARSELGHWDNNSREWRRRFMVFDLV